MGPFINKHKKWLKVAFSIRLCHKLSIDISGVLILIVKTGDFHPEVPKISIVYPNSKLVFMLIQQQQTFYAVIRACIMNAW